MKHPTKPIELYTNPSGRVICAIKGHAIGDLTTTGLIPLTDEERAKNQAVSGMDLAGYLRPEQMITTTPTGMSPEVAAWVEANLPVVRAEGVARADRAAEAEAERQRKRVELRELIANKVAEVRIPRESIRLQVKNLRSFDGWPSFDLETPSGSPIFTSADGVKGEIINVTPGDIPDAAVFWSTREAVAKADATEAERLIKQQANKVARDEKLNAEVPIYAIAAYKACSGNPENFEDEIDDPRYWQVKEFADAIEHQGLAGDASLQKLSAELREAAREQATEEGNGI